MARIISIEGSARHPLWWKAVVTVALLIIVVAAVYAAARDTRGTSLPAAVESAVPQRKVEWLPAAAVSVSPPAADASVANVLASCPHQAIDVSSVGSMARRECVLPTKLVQSGSLRTYVLEPQGVSEWTLRLDTDGHSLMRASWSAPGQPEYRCEQSCTGMSFGRRDRQGVRVLRVVDLALTADADQNTANTSKQAVLSASLVIRSDAEDTSLACTGPSVAVVENPGGAFTFCASGGTGIARPDDGRQRFEMRGSEGDLLLVELDSAGAIERVQLGDLRCIREACSGASTQDTLSVGSEPSRSFDFSGVTLIALNDKHRSATLNGSIVVPTM